MHALRALKSPVLLLLLAAFALGIAAGSLLPDRQAENSDILAPLRETWRLIQSEYIEQVEDERLLEGALRGAVAALDDEFSLYITPDEYAREYNYSGEFTGIGVIVKTNAAGNVEVAEVVADTPAERAGVLPGDVFVEVDGVNALGFTQGELSELVPGPRGTKVRVTFRRGENLLTLDIRRDVFVVPNARYQALAGNMAYISLRDFDNLARTQLDDALAAVDVNASAGLILDLRDNPGGVLESAVDIASLFLDEGEVALRQVNRAGDVSLTRSAGAETRIEVPIALLVDADSASASEVLAGALQDHGRATVIGEPTFGKGTVQSVRALGNGGAVRLTTRRFLTPLGREIDGIGVIPDIVVAWDGEGADIQLEAAIAYLESLKTRE